MGIFKKDKNPADEEVREFAGVGEEDDLVPEEDENFIRSMQDPSYGRGVGGGSSRKKAVMVLLIGLPVVMGMFLWFGYSTLKSFGIFSSSEPKSTAVVQVSDEEYARLAEENRELRERLSTVERQSSTMMSNIENTIDRRLEDLVKKISGDGAIPEKEREAMRKQQAEMEALLAEIRLSLEEKKKAEAVPGAGSNVPTTSYTAVRQWTDARNQEEADRLRAIAEYKAPFDKRVGVALGTSVPGILKNTLISSSMIDRFFAVIETTQRVEISGGHYLPQGVRFLGKVRADFESRRLIVDITKLQYGDVDVNVEGILLDVRGNPGIVTKYIDPLQQSLWSTFLPNMLAAAASAAKEMYEYVDGDGYYRTSAKPTLENAAYQGASDALRMQSQILLEIQSRKKPVILAHSGLQVQVQLTQKLPLDLLMEAGVIEKGR